MLGRPADLPTARPAQRTSDGDGAVGKLYSACGEVSFSGRVSGVEPIANFTEHIPPFGKPRTTLGSGHEFSYAARIAPRIIMAGNDSREVTHPCDPLCFVLPSASWS